MGRDVPNDTTRPHTHGHTHADTHTCTYPNGGGDVKPISLKPNS